MNTHYLQTIADETIKTVGVQFNQVNGYGAASYGGKIYVYKTRLELEQMDLAIVSTQNGFTVVRVVEIHEEPEIQAHDSREYAWILQKVGRDDYNLAFEADRAFSQKVAGKQRQVLRAQAKAAIQATFGEDIDLASMLETSRKSVEVDFDMEAEEL